TSAITNASGGNLLNIYNNYVSVSSINLTAMDGLWFFYEFFPSATTNIFDNIVENCFTANYTNADFDGWRFLDFQLDHPANLNVYNNIIRNNHQNSNHPMVFYTTF